jgi:PAS domain
MRDHSHAQLKGAEYVVFFDSDRQYVDCSEGVCRLVGYSRKDILKKRIDDLSYGVHRLENLFATFLRHGKLSGEYVLRQSNGAPLPLRYWSYVFPDGSKGSTWELITDWRAPYLAALAGSTAQTQELAVDVAFAAIYQRLAAGQAQSLQSDRERTAIVDALSELHKLCNQSKSLQNVGRYGFDKTRLALLRLADDVHDAAATQILLHENRLLLGASLQKWLGIEYSERSMSDLVNYLSNRARYYNPVEHPVVWLNTCLDMECRRLLREMKKT